MRHLLGCFHVAPVFVSVSVSRVLVQVRLGLLKAEATVRGESLGLVSSKLWDEPSSMAG